MKIIFPLLALACLTPYVSAGIALILGILLAVTLGNPYLDRTRKITPQLLQFSVMGLGAGMNLQTVAKAGVSGVGYTVIGISFTFLIGFLLKKALKVERDVSLLITVGTAICGGSAIAAVAPAIRAKNHDVSVALGTVFLLNAFALLIFPPIGHFLNLSETQFGLWCALAIHDTSSVVGATLQYGAHALEVGTTVKLARALWIVPLTFAIGSLRARQEHHEGTGKGRPSIKRPWFILGFLVAAAVVTYIPILREPGQWVELAARRALVLTLFLIGTNLNRDAIRSVGIRPLLQGVLLWIMVGCTTLAAIYTGWI